ncbi:lipopolysaccharide assembly protein LapB [Candidatus Spongiihabitans sp.]|uniref:lipopolysaccharide assembly protein LapB n=1 Tax=Candidatus Spongiihabitans sp. TaxID=3101308 RepID=UPI003C7CA08A
MDPIWLLLLLPLAAAGGWLMSAHDKSAVSKSSGLPEAYFKGLSFLLNEQPDKALQVFLEVVEVDQETVEMHMALGNLFRRRGEVERATRIHQNLVARSDIDDSLRALALFELAQDYFKAGLFDRAENLFQELQQVSEYQGPAGRFLLQIYDQEKEWRKAIQIAKQLDRLVEQDFAQTIAHYYCELAEKAIAEGGLQDAEARLESAFRHDARCIRAVIQSGRLAAMHGNHTNAIAIWRGLEHWAAQALGEVVGHVSSSYAALNDEHSLQKFLESALEKNADPRIIAMLVELTHKNNGREAGQALMLSLVRKYPSLESMYQLMKSHEQDMTPSRQDKDFSLLADLLAEVVETGRNYHCRQCGFQSNSLHWQCPGCKGWGTAQRQIGNKLTLPPQPLAAG